MQTRVSDDYVLQGAEGGGDSAQSGLTRLASKGDGTDPNRAWDVAPERCAAAQGSGPISLLPGESLPAKSPTARIHTMLP